MTADPVSFVRSSSSSPIRPLHVPRDLGAVADLIELCFANTLDADGRLYVSRMRNAARKSTSLNTLLDFGASDWQTGGLPSGFVWLENGRLVGNLSLIPFDHSLFGWGEKTHLIANVAVHPDFRRRGIARALTQAALSAMQVYGAPRPWLHVRDDNAAAQALYLSIGFEEQYRRSTWHSRTGSRQNLASSVQRARLTVRAYQGSDWREHKDWFLRTYPSSMSFYTAIHTRNLQPGLRGAVYRLMNEVFVRQWSACEDGRLRGCISWQPTQAYADNLWLAVAPDCGEDVVQALLGRALERFSDQRPLALDYPAGESAATLRACGFHVHHTLIWMRASDRVFHVSQA